MVLLLIQKRSQREKVASMAPLDPSLVYDDPRLVQLVGKNFLNPPSTEPYTFMQDFVHTNVHAAEYVLYKAEFAYEFCQKVIKDIFEGSTPGFYVEAGALDGEFLSNTLPLEKERGWTGLLVEADGDMFGELLGKKRRAWASHSCLATRAHAHTGILIKYVRQNNFQDEFSNHAARAHASLLDATGGATLDGSKPGHPVYEPVQCIPLATLLLAINITHVDLVSLDVEGAEVGILQHFPWGRVKVDVWVVEHAHALDQSILDDAASATLADSEFVNMFLSHGYEVYRISQDLVIPNYVFVLRGTAPYHRLRTRGK